MQGIRKIEGERVYLAPMNVEDAPLYVRWLNDPEISVYLNAFSVNIGLEREREFLAQSLKEQRPEFGIRLVEDDRLIGNCGIVNIDNINRKAEIGIFIGERDLLGQGYGREAVMLLLDYGFNILNLNNIYLRPYSFNTRAIRCYEACGFKVAGRLREAKIINGEKYDEVWLDILASEFPGAGLHEKLNDLLGDKE
ncbi:MAG: GNAT family N-acetyltransferase [Deltaproteobacteria bacterium]